MIDQKNSKTTIIHLLILFLSAFAIRACAFHNTLMMNLDGPVYIHQARALYYGLWGSIGNCSAVDYLSLYSILIAVTYPITGNWVHAAMGVNLIFGTLMIIPLYLFLRRFIDEKSSFVTAFIFAMLPVLVIQSVNIIRDPSFWFFSILGLYLLVYGDEKRKYLFLILSSVSFLVATATRIEGIIFLICGCLYTICVFKENKWKATIIFISPVILFLGCFIMIQLIRHPDELYWYRLQEIPSIAMNTLKKYRHIEANLTKIYSDTPPGIMHEFIENSRTLIWFMAIGVVFQSALEAFFYIFFLLWLIGLVVMIEKMRNDSRILPLVITTAISCVVLYLYCLNIWSMENRRLVMVMLPSAILVGFGIEKIIKWMREKFKLSDAVTVAMLCFLVFSMTITKNLRPQEEDKLVFKEIGQTVALLDGSAEEIKLITMGATFRWNNYYANLHVKGAPCPENNYNWINKGILEGSYKDFISDIREKKFRYIIWEEKQWPVNTFSFPESVQTNDLKKLKEWNHPDTGRIILYKVIFANKK